MYVPVPASCIDRVYNSYISNLENTLIKYLYFRLFAPNLINIFFPNVVVSILMVPGIKDLGT